MIIGSIIPISTYPNRPGYPGYKLLTNIYSYSATEYYSYVDTWYSLIFVFLIGIAIISLLSIIGSVSSKLKLFSKKKVLFVTLVIFFFFPMFGTWADYVPMSITIASEIRLVFSGAAYRKLNPTYEFSRNIMPGLYLVIIGFLLLLISLLLTSLIVFWHKSEKKGETGIERYGTESKGALGFTLEISLIFIGILAGLGIILGIARPNYFYVYRSIPGDERITSLLLPETSFYTGSDYIYQKYLDFEALFYLILISFVAISLLIFFLTKIRIIKKPVTIAPPLFFLVVTFLLPSPNPYGSGVFGMPAGVLILYNLRNLFYNATRDFARYEDAVTDDKLVVGFFGWILFISILVMYIVIILFAAKSLYTKRKSPEGLVKEKIKEDY